MLVETSYENLTVRDVKGTAEITCSSGNITVENISGETNISGSYGEINIVDISDNLTVQASNSSITGKRVTGDADITTSYENVVLRNITGRLKLDAPNCEVDVETVGGDGNLLLNVGPMPDGRIEARQADRLKELGNWLEQNGESIYGTRGGPFKPAKWGVSTSKGSKIYLHILKVEGKKLKLPKLDKKVLKCNILHGDAIDFSQTNNELSIPLKDLNKDKVDNIIVLEME